MYCYKQTIARVNSPYENKEGRQKPCGFVLDFIGIFSDLQKALAFDSADIEGVINDIEELKKHFVQLIQFEVENFKELKELDKSLKTLPSQDKESGMDTELLYR